VIGEATELEGRPGKGGRLWSKENGAGWDMGRTDWGQMEAKGAQGKCVRMNKSPLLTLSNVLNSHATALYLRCTMFHSLWMELGCS